MNEMKNNENKLVGHFQYRVAIIIIFFLFRCKNIFIKLYQCKKHITLLAIIDLGERRVIWRGARLAHAYLQENIIVRLTKIFLLPKFLHNMHLIKNSPSIECSKHFYKKFI